MSKITTAHPLDQDQLICGQSLRSSRVLARTRAASRVAAARSLTSSRPYGESHKDGGDYVTGQIKIVDLLPGSAQRDTSLFKGRNGLDDPGEEVLRSFITAASAHLPCARAP
jgi:hypothetical protein